MVAAAKTIAWGRKHGSLALVLDEDNYITVKKYAGAKIDQLTKPAPVNK